MASPWRPSPGALIPGNDVTLNQMIPRTGVATFHDVGHERSLALSDLFQLTAQGDATAVFRQPRAKHIGDMHQPIARADRTLFVGWCPDLASSTNKLRVSITSIGLGDIALTKLADRGLSGQPIVDLSSARGGGIARHRLKNHASNASSLWPYPARHPRSRVLRLRQGGLGQYVRPGPP